MLLSIHNNSSPSLIALLFTNTGSSRDIFMGRLLIHCDSAAPCADEMGTVSKWQFAKPDSKLPAGMRRTAQKGSTKPLPGLSALGCVNWGAKWTTLSLRT